MSLVQLLQRWRFIPRYSRLCLSTSAHSLVSSPDPSLFLNARNPNHSAKHSPPSSHQLQNSVDGFSRSRFQIKPQPSPKTVGHCLPLGSDTYKFLVQRYQFSCLHSDANELHFLINKNGFAGDTFLLNIAINIYVKSGDLKSARSLFDEMPNRNHVTWSCLISGYTRNGFPMEGFSVFKEMVSGGYSLNTYAIASVVQACQVSGPEGLKLGLQVHGLVSKTPLAFNAAVCNVFISLYGKHMDSLDYAFRVFEGMEGKNSISWNSIISVCSQRGDTVAAFDLFSGMQQEGLEFEPNEYTFGSLITAASASMDYGLCLLQQMLATIEKSGSLKDLYVSSALVNGFARFGLLDIAKKVFEQMDVRNAVSVNGLMVGLVRQKRGEEAAEFFSKMKDLVSFNSDSLAVLLSAFSQFSVIEEARRRGRELHAYVVRTGLLDSKVEVGNGLINMYSKCGAVSEACSVFKLMVNKDSVSWNSMITGLDQNKCFENAILCFSTMKRTGLMSANFTLISVLNSCGSLGWIKLGEQVHCEGLKLGLDLDVSVSNSLLALYAETGHLSEARKVFSLMADYDIVSWNSVIGSFSVSEEHSYESVRYLRDMMRDGWSLNKVTFINILVAVSSMFSTELAHQIHAQVLKYNFTNDVAIENALISCYGKCGVIEECEKVFSKMTERRDDISWNCMISGYIHNELLPKAMDLVWFMLQSGRRLDSFTLASVLSACTSVATLERGMEVHACAIRTCLVSGIVIGSALVDMYSKCGRIDYASRFFELMHSRNVYSWNSMISGYARHGHGNKALELFEKMKLDHQKPDHVTFVGVLSACSHMGLVKQGFRHFDSMIDVYGLIPQMEHFSCMVDLLGRAGELDKMEDFVGKMPMEPNVLIWRTVLGACCRANGRKTDLGQRAAEMLFQVEPKNAANYVLLANMYASGGKWHEVAKARVTMKEATAKKDAGCSWVTMKDGVHTFVAGDQSHRERDAIYEKLRELQGKMRDAGYVPVSNSALYDLELESKEELLSYHSEKLAVAFVLTRKSELPIRIMKNLRVCGDCHLAFKFISQIVGRQIILRDSNRFHHFSDGKCSCGDYW